MPLDVLARFQADGAYALLWRIPKPGGFDNDANMLKPMLLVRFKEIYRSSRSKTRDVAE